MIIFCVFGNTCFAKGKSYHLEIITLNKLGFLVKFYFFQLKESCLAEKPTRFLNDTPRSLISSFLSILVKIFLNNPI